MKSREEIFAAVKVALSKKRFDHTIMVAENAVILADLYGIDKKAMWAMAMLHDIAKEMDSEEMFAVADKYGYTISKLSLDFVPNMHAEVGALIAEKEFGFKDRDFLNAIKYHVLGRPAMSVPEKILFICDHTEPSRPNPARMSYLFEMAKTDLDETMLRFISMLLEYQNKRGYSLSIRERIWETFDYLLDERRKNKQNFPKAGSSAGLLTDVEFDAALEVIRRNRISVKSVQNIRTLGGFISNYGKCRRTVKTKGLVRSADLSRLTEEEALYLKEESGLTLIIDLRTPAEIAKAPDRKIPGVDYVKAPLIQAYSGIRADYLTERYIKSASEREKAWLLSEYARIPMVRSMYQSMFTDKEALNTFGQIFRLIQSEEGTVLFHCTSGKDRTGVLSAMLLYVLGCDEKDIINDYNASAISFNAMSENHMELLKRYEYEEDVLIGLQSTLSVVPEAIREGLDRITSRYPAREMFAMEVLGMNEEEIDNFQNKFLTE